ncbi:MAG: hypothetical protein WA637_03135, partial [Terriglobales bacterium]
MIAASAYVLKVSPDRRGILLDDDNSSYFSEEPSIAEPVPRFDHSRRAPIVVLASFADGSITHIADGR